MAVWQQNSSARLPGPLAVGFAAPTLLWLTRHQQQVFEQTAHVLAIKDWVRHKLTGAVAADHSDASAMWLYDLNTQDWSTELLQFCGWRCEPPPPIKYSSEKAGELTANAARQWGLLAGIPVAVGAADLAAQALDHGIIALGRIYRFTPGTRAWKSGAISYGRGLPRVGRTSGRSDC